MCSNMQEAADLGDPDYKRVLEGTNNDPIKVIENVSPASDTMRELRPYTDVAEAQSCFHSPLGTLHLDCSD